jgi:hypothetical protein
MAVILAGGTATGAMAAVTSVAASSAQQSTPTAPGAPTGLTAAPRQRHRHPVVVGAQLG